MHSCPRKESSFGIGPGREDGFGGTAPRWMFISCSVVAKQSRSMEMKRVVVILMNLGWWLYVVIGFRVF